jgi:polysaccharide deacetylase family protein (PEP-CTERM system associated)
VPGEQWESLPVRVVDNTLRLLDMLARHQVRATFFVLGWLAERQPDLVRSILGAGHEVACHSHSHALMYNMTVEAFRNDLERAMSALRNAGAAEVVGYRAPSFSLTRPVHNFLEILAVYGFRYDSSLFPIRHPRYGQPDAPRRPFLLKAGAAEMVVVPMTTARLAGMNLPFSGGGYLRLCPGPLWRVLRAMVHRQGLPVMVYLHPWELDPYRPAVRASLLNRWRSLAGQGTVQRKLTAILAEGSFQTLAAYAEQQRTNANLPKSGLPLACI